MLLFDKFNINLNKVKYDANKKSLFIVIRKSPGEYDFIAYFLNELKKKYNIFVIFNNLKSYSLLKSNNFLFNNFKKICFGYLINSKYRYFYSRILLRIFKKFKINHSSYEKNLNKNIYNFDKLKKEILNNIKIPKKKFYANNDVLFCSFENKSGWLNEFKNKNKKIILFPEKTNLLNFKNKKSKFSHSNKKILALFPNKEFYSNYKNLVEFNNYIYCGYPKFNKNWTKLFTKKNKKQNKLRTTIFYKTYESHVYDKEKYLEQLYLLIKVLKKFNLSIYFNLHPLAKEGFEKYFNYKQLKNFKISKNNIAQDIIDSDILIFKYGTNSILDCVAFNKYPIELWSLKHKKFFYQSVYDKKKLTLRSRNKKELETHVKNLLIKKKYPTIENQRKKYFLNTKKTKNVEKQIIKFIES